jgi:archaellum component FlaC
MTKIILILFTTLSTLAFDVPPPYKSGDNTGENKLDRLERMEKYIGKFSSILSEVKSKLEKQSDGDKVLEKLKMLEETQKSLSEELNNFKENDFKRLKLKVDFVDKEKVEKLIDRFNLYKSDTDRKINVLKESIKEIEALVKTVDSPYKK